jgi:hypothetical protein
MQVTFDFANQRIEVQGDGPELVNLFAVVREIAPKLPSITFKSEGVAAAGKSAQGANGGGAAPPDGGTGAGGVPATQTMRQFVRSISLGSLSEKIAAIAYYQARHLSRPTFAPKDMSDWFTQCGLEKPSQMPVAVFDAKKKNGYVENAGHGAWKLATQGENLIIRKIEEASEKKE